jgi:hypothetical protein
MRDYSRRLKLILKNSSSSADESAAKMISIKFRMADEEKQLQAFLSQVDGLEEFSIEALQLANSPATLVRVTKGSASLRDFVYPEAYLFLHPAATDVSACAAFERIIQMIDELKTPE